MRADRVCLGQAPVLEESFRIDSRDGAQRAKAQCRAFVAAISKVCGREPEWAHLVIHSQESEHGAFFEMACVFDPDDEWVCDDAARVDAGAPTTWEQAGVRPPAKSARSR